ncbi:YfgM family protein [Gayadomonas joobiniege]|uniref:YfgM family protein n=1 Tax=Gayadomonas joobiniege TaxID=1234606 RepID=UPI0003814DD6|nr:tetratricopeptide repeat protein [Gayadomonas joobiniege]
MEIYSTEEQQVEAIKSFWAKYGKAVIGGVILGLGGIYGYKVWQQNKLEAQEALSVQYNGLIESQNIDQAAANDFVNQNSDSGYAELAALNLAKSYVAENQLAKASEQLSWVVKQSSDPALQDLARIRLSRVQIAQQDFQAAIATLDAVVNEGFKTQAAELKGDAYYFQEDLDRALMAYQAAADAGGLDNSPTLKLKLDNLNKNNGVVAL